MTAILVQRQDDYASAAGQDAAERVRYDISNPELTADQFEGMLTELNAICRQARELSTQITLQMDEQKHRRRQAATPLLRFPRAVESD